MPTVGVASVSGPGFAAEGEDLSRRSQNNESVVEQRGSMVSDPPEKRIERIKDACPLGASESSDAGTERRSAIKVAERGRCGRARHRVVDLETDRKVGRKRIRGSLHVRGRMEIVAPRVELELPEA